MNNLTPTQAAHILTRLYWVANIDLLSFTLTDGDFDYDSPAVDAGEMAQKERDVRAVLEGIATQEQPRRAA